MKQKIEWYREVLELEPGSRVFFPLSKLLAEDGQIHDAVIALRQGVLRHPDHVEARLFLVELLATQGATSDLTLEVERLGSLFAAYPGFWEAWGRELDANPAMRDAALAIRFFAAALEGRQLTWGSIIEHGLLSLLRNPEDSTLQNSGPYVTRGPAEATAAMPAHVGFLADITAAPEETAPLPSPSSLTALSDSTAETDFEDMEEDGDEAFSLRTRSMAEVLAEQGDISEALEIYKELILAAPEEEKGSLETRAEELSRRMASGAASQEASHLSTGEAGARDGNRLTGLLESLAERLEARAR